MEWRGANPEYNGEQDVRFEKEFEGVATAGSESRNADRDGVQDLVREKEFGWILFC